ncbi:TPA: hypothetical protein ACF3P8_003863, partial [Serratia marcescens]
APAVPATSSAGTIRESTRSFIVIILVNYVELRPLPFSSIISTTVHYHSGNKGYINPERK